MVAAVAVVSWSADCSIVESELGDLGELYRDESR